MGARNSAVAVGAAFAPLGVFESRSRGLVFVGLAAPGSALPFRGLRRAHVP